MCIYLAIPPLYTEGSVSVESGSDTVTGAGTNWTASLKGKPMRIGGELAEYKVSEVKSPTQLTLDPPYSGTKGAGRGYGIRHPLFVDYGTPTEWAERYYVLRPLLGAGARVSASVVSLDGDPDLSGVDRSTNSLFLENDKARPDRIYRLVAVDNAAKTVTVDGAPNIGTEPSPWIIGPPESFHEYEVFLPTPDGTFRRGLPLAPSLADPIVYAHVGVSAADDKDHAPDDPKWEKQERWGNRPGNEGRIGSPAKVFRVLREEPKPPAPPPDAERVFATPADYHGLSYYTYRWQPADNLKTHIFRALDDALFTVDWLIRTTRTSLNPTDPQHEAIFPNATSWDLDRKQAAASQLNAITSLDSYATLSSDARHLLARLPGNEDGSVGSTLQERDWAIRTSRKALDANDTQYFPGEWNDTKRQAVATDLNSIALFGRAARVTGRSVTLDGAPNLAPLRPNRATYWLWLQSDTRRSDRRYRITAIDNAADTVTLDEDPSVPADTSTWMIDANHAMSNDALRVLAALPGNERAFTQLTIQSLDPTDPANLNRKGPDDPDDFEVWDSNTPPEDRDNPLEDPALRVYIDTLDGRSTNRYFYRVVYVDGAHNRSNLSLSSPPVYLPNVVPPRTPVITKVLGGERQITLSWASNREPDLAEYRVYRADSEEAARNLRLMTLVSTQQVPSSVPAADRPAEISWTDDGLVGGSHYHYRIVAVDEAANVSAPSDVASVAVVDTRIPDPPVWLETKWVVLRDADSGEEEWPADGVIGAGKRPALRLVWTSDVAEATFAITRRARGELAWRPIAAEDDYERIALTQYLLYDANVSPDENYSYRIRVTSSTGISSIEFRERQVARP